MHKNTSIQEALLVSLASFVILLWLGPILGGVYTSYLANNSEAILKEAIANDEKNLFEQGNKIAEIDLLKDYIDAGDSYRILGILNQEKEKLGDLIDIIGVTDKDGFVISRNQTFKGLGDNFFISTAMGRLLSKNIATSSVEIRGVDPTQLLIVTGRLITDNGYRKGSLVTNKILGDKYATELKAKLPTGAEAIFYTKDYGICGMSLDKQSERRTVQAYFNPDSDFVKNGKTEDVVSLHYGQSYFVKNIKFPGLERSPGGVILLIPDYASKANIQLAVAFLTFIIFALLIFLGHRNKPREDKGKIYYLMVVAAFIFLGAIIFLVNTAYFINYVRSKKTPVVLYNSTLRLSPDSATFNSEFESNVSIIVDTGEENVNAFDVGINFDPDMISVDDVAIENSVCDQFLEKSIDNKVGKVRITCIVVSPGYIGRNGNLADLIFKIKKSGQISLVFDRDTEVLANDGLGTSVLRTMLSGSYYGNGLATTAGGEDGGDWLSISPHIYSPTHPNSERWYRRGDVEFIWNNPGQKTFAYSFDQLPFTIPSVSSTVTTDQFSKKINESGIYYFHLAYVDGGAIGSVSHYKVMIDLDGPKNVTIQSSAIEVEVGDIVHFVFSATSANSGLQRAFYLNVGGGGDLFYPVGHETYVPLLDPLGAGIQKITLRVFDRAGNYVDKTVEIKVKGSPIRNFINSTFSNF